LKTKQPAQNPRPDSNAANTVRIPMTILEAVIESVAKNRIRAMVENISPTA
jgi:hypothetical protein